MDQSRENRIEDSQDEIDIGELLRYLKTKWIVLVAVFLIGVIGAGVGTKCLLTPRYTAVSKLYVVSASGKNIVNLDDFGSFIIGLYRAFEDQTDLQRDHQ